MAKEIEDIGKEALKALEADTEADIEPTPTPIMVVSIEELQEKLASDIELTPDEAAAYAVYSKEKARVAQVMTRGVVNDKLQRIIDHAVPEGRVGKFIRDVDDDIVRYKLLNYDFIYAEGAPKGLHGEADNRIRVGDVVLVTISKANLKILRDVKRDRVQWKLDQGKQDYVGRAAAAEKGGDGLVESFDNSHQEIHRAHN